ncbi:MAG: NUDIX domain-containing protein [Candidatus Paceibacterota bacterium]|nr:MAG: NUDIX domain-containing protein [Candidatus Paceibacterota bacterium]
MAEKKRSVGLVVLTKVPEVGVVAVLQRRGKFNPEKLADGKIKESYPGGCQVTCHGRVELGDDDEEAALLREAQEELGLEAAHKLLVQNRGRLVKLVEHRGDTEDATTFGIFMPDPDFLKLIHLGPSSGGLELLPGSEVGNICHLRDFDKSTGVTDLDVIAMYYDERGAVRLAFDKLVPKG